MLKSSYISAQSPSTYSIDLNDSLYKTLLSFLVQYPSSTPASYSPTIHISVKPSQSDHISSPNNVTYTHRNADVFFGITNGNVSAENENWTYCPEWRTVQPSLYQTANVVMFIAFLMPTIYKQNLLLVRFLLIVSYILLSCYSSNNLCAPDMLIWNILMCLINLVYTCTIIWTFIPPTLSLELTELYVKIFQPLRISKKHFNELVKEAQMEILAEGDIYAVEDASPADERLSILISGKLRVTCEDTHLHFIQPHQFIDSPEWEANHEQSDDLFQVTITAEENSLYLCWARMKLERVLRYRPLLKFVLDSIIGKDITQKLYSLNDHLFGLDNERTRFKQHEIQEIWEKATRSMSMDAVYTGSTGKVRSFAFRSARKNELILNVSSLSITDCKHTRLQKQCWIPIVANHFPAEFPFHELQAYNAQIESRNAVLLANDSQQMIQVPSTTNLILPQSDVLKTTIKGTHSKGC